MPLITSDEDIFFAKIIENILYENKVQKAILMRFIERGAEKFLIKLKRE